MMGFSLPPFLQSRSGDVDPASGSLLEQRFPFMKQSRENVSACVGEREREATAAKVERTSVREGERERKEGRGRAAFPVVCESS